MYSGLNNQNNKKQKGQYHVGRWLLVILACLLLTIPIGFIIKSCTSKDNSTHSDTKYSKIYENLLNSLKILNNDISKLITVENADGSYDYKIAATNTNEDKIYLANLHIQEEIAPELFKILEDSTIEFGTHYSYYSFIDFTAVSFLDYDINQETVSKIAYYGKSNSDEYYVFSSYVLNSNKSLHVTSGLNFVAPSNEEEKPIINVNQFVTYPSNGSPRYLINRYIHNLDIKNRA